MIEKTIMDYLNEHLEVPVWLELPEGEETPESYVLLEKTGSGRKDHISTATFAVQSYGKRMIDAARLNEQVKAAMDSLVTLNEVSRSALNSDYNFTDTQKKQYRYQAVYDIVHY